MTDITIEQGSTITIKLPGLTAVRIDTARRYIAVDGISGLADGPGAPDYLVHDLRTGIYGDFHRLRDPSECFDHDCAHLPDCADPECGGCGQHIQGAYPHRHHDIEEVARCQECIDRAADLRVLADV